MKMPTMLATIMAAAAVLVAAALSQEDHQLNDRVPWRAS